MAIIKDGILGGFSGKVGTVVGVKKGNEYYMRSLPRKRTKFTEKELINQAKFKLVQDYLKPIKGLLTVGYNGYFTKTGGYRAAIAYTRKHALVADDAGFYIDPALFRISGGDLEQAISPQVAVENTRLKFSWENAAGTVNSADQLLVLVYDYQKHEALSVVFNGGYRSARSFSLDIPSEFSGKEVDIYIGFMAADRSKQSDSQYLGRVQLS